MLTEFNIPQSTPPLSLFTRVPEQLTQLESSVSPSTVPYIPGGHLWHGWLPVEFLYVPGGQRTQFPVLISLVYPARHTPDKWYVNHDGNASWV